MRRLPLIEAPTLVMSGEEDGLRRTVEPVASKLKRSRTYIGPGGSYLKTYEDPEALGGVILDFLSDPGV
jgi:pimeloyl-ACP methyl ester carboxylesterase